MAQAFPESRDDLEIRQDGVGPGQGMHQNKEQEGDIDRLPDGLAHPFGDAGEVDVEGRVVQDDHVHRQEDDERDRGDTLELKESHGGP